MNNHKINEKNCTEEFPKLLGQKIERDKNSNFGRKWKPYKYMTYEEKKRLSDREAFKDNKKQEIRNNPKILKNLDFDKKSIRNIIKPATPHNTSQFLSTNFCLGRTEKIANSEVSIEYPQEDQKDESIIEADDYCIPGGSMTGKLEGLLISDILLSNAGALSTEDENEPVLRRNLTSSFCGPVMCENLDSFKHIIENQEKLINHLITILNQGAESKVNKSNLDIP